jgi:hypothetical protein
MRIGFKRGNHWYAPIIQAFTHSEFSHVAVSINGRLYESVATRGDRQTSGVRDYYLIPEVAKDYIWFDCNVNDDDALQRYARVYGHSYDFFSLLAFIPFVRARDSDCEYCYELAAIMLGMEIKGRITPEILLLELLKAK